MQSNAALCSIPTDLLPRVLENLKRHGTPEPITGCVLYTGWVSPRGYGRFGLWYQGKKMQIRAHRAAWIVANGAIDDPSLVIDHRCERRLCINVDHMVLVSPKVNSARQRRRTTRASLGVHECPNGHPWTEENTGYESNGRTSNGRQDKIRFCRACQVGGLR